MKCFGKQLDELKLRRSLFPGRNIVSLVDPKFQNKSIANIAKGT